MSQVTRLYDRSGTQLLYEFYDERRIFVRLSDVAPVMIKATLAAEDVNFYAHPGFDIRGIARAILNDFTRRRAGGGGAGGAVGGSTITQQIVKRVLLTDEQTYARKLRELVLAIQVERIYSKDEVLELYLNQVFYGNQSYGIEAAALSYFGKHASDLGLAEATILAGLVQAPSEYDPARNPRAALARQEEVLNVMVRHGLATRIESTAARAEAERFDYQRLQTRIVVPHFSFFARDQLVRRIDPEALRRGLRVITTIDLGMQDTAQGIVARRVENLRKQQVNNGALVAVDPRTGEILAMVGSADFEDPKIDGQVNVATSLRQPGSSFKPLAWAALFATRKYVPSTTVLDEELTRPDPGSPSGKYQPRNYDGKFHGTVTLRSALANSYNIPAILVQETVGTKELVRVAKALGVSTSLPEVQSLVLGAGTVRLLDMSGAYATIANGGVRREPTPFLQITDSNGRVLYDATNAPVAEAITPDAAYMVTSILSDNRARYPMFGTVLDLSGGRVAAVKTGTTSDYKDSLTIGYVPSLVIGAWVGNSDARPMLQVAGSLGAGTIWKEAMEAFLKGRPNEPFTQPASVIRANVCGATDLAFATSPAPQCGIAGAGPVRTPRPTPVLPPS
jgi:membrane peptidoglycan carboxypeptidase